MEEERKLLGWIAFYNDKRLEIVMGRDADSL